MIRHAYSTRLVPAFVAMLAAGSVAALDTDQAFSPLVINGVATDAAPYHVGVDGALKSKVLDNGLVVQDDSALGVNGSFRAYGFGLAIETDWAVGQSPDTSRPGDRTNPGELVRAAATLDMALEIRDPRNTAVPLLQIIPHLSFVTYPNRAGTFGPRDDSYLKFRQRWLGVDAWWMLPVEGVEIGAGIEQNISSEWRAFRGNVGAREFLQTTSIDFSFWQTLGFADSEYRWVVGGKDKSGLTTVDLGSRATLPFFLKDLYSFVQVDISYWMDKDIRDNYKDAGMDGGNVVISVGLNWIPE